MIRADTHAAGSPLICTTPFYAPVAEQWPGDTFYYLTDLTAAYPNMDRGRIHALDRRMCKAARAVFPNSQRIADYLRQDAHCADRKITIIPNATRSANLLNGPLLEALEAPRDLAHLPRPMVGVIGNLAENMDWVLLLATVERTTGFSWVFVGPTDMEVVDPMQRKARLELMQWGRRVRFVGPKPYGMLCEYARALDAAVLPYHNHEPTYSGSSTRFYEHLAACRPMLATRGFYELLSKEPLLKLITTAEQLATELERLRTQKFRDGLEEARWLASRDETWEARAETMIRVVSQTGAGHAITEREPRASGGLAG